MQSHEFAFVESTSRLPLNYSYIKNSGGRIIAFCSSYKLGYHPNNQLQNVYSIGYHLIRVWLETPQGFAENDLNDGNSQLLFQAVKVIRLIHCLCIMIR